MVSIHNLSLTNIQEENTDSQMFISWRSQKCFFKVALLTERFRESDYSALVFPVTHRNRFFGTFTGFTYKEHPHTRSYQLHANKVFYSTSSKRPQEPSERYIKHFLSAGHCHRTNRLVLVVFKLFKRMISHNQFIISWP